MNHHQVLLLLQVLDDFSVEEVAEITKRYADDDWDVVFPVHDYLSGKLTDEGLRLALLRVTW